MENVGISVVDEETRRQKITAAWNYMWPIDAMPLEEMQTALGVLEYAIINAISVQQLGRLGQAMLLYGDDRAREAMSPFLNDKTITSNQIS